MWIVKFFNGKRHSAWASKKDALAQAWVLSENGYEMRAPLRENIEFDETVRCENGHYYV